MKTGVRIFLRKIVPIIMVALMVLAFSAPMMAVETTSDNPFIYSDLNKTPSGTYGYLIADGDEMAFSLENSGITKNTEIRFFGVEFSLAKGIPSKGQATSMAQTLLDKGINFVCLKDVYAALTTSTGELDETKFTAFDAFIFELYLKGIYVEIDFFTAQSLGTSNVGAFVDQDVVAKAIRFLRRFFNHVGPNDTTYALENMIVAVKYIDNASVGYLADGQTALYADVLKKGFNEWLYTKYETNDKLASAWTAKDGTSALAAGETIGNVNIGNIGTSTDLLFNTASLNSARQADFTAYLTSAAGASFKLISDSIKSYGYRSLIICSDASTGPLSTRVSGFGSAAAKTISYDGSNINEAMKSASSGVITGKPFILNWNTSSTSVKKSEAFSELIVYSCMQGYDAFIAGEYVLNPDAGQYSVSNDEEIWSQLGMFATVFRHRSITPSRTQIDYVYTTDDTASETGNFGKITSIASFISKVGTTFVDSAYVSGSGLAITSGNTSGGDYTATTNDLIVQSFTKMTSPFMKSFDKEGWYNKHVEKKAMEQMYIDNYDFRIGSSRAIAVDGTVENSNILTQIMLKLGILSEGFGYTDGVIKADNSQVVYNTKQDYITAIGNRVAVFSGKLPSEDVVCNNVTYNGNGSSVAVVVTPMDSNNIDASASLLIYARGENASDTVNGSLTFQRENSTFKFYGINDDGSRSDVLAESESNVVTKQTTVTLDGNYKNYELVFIEKSVDDVLEGYTPTFPTRPNLLLLISIPAIIFLAVAYAGIILADKLKIKREEKLRLASMETKLKSRIAHDEHIKRFEEEMEQERLEKERKAMEKDFGYNPLLDETIPEDIRKEMAEEMRKEQEAQQKNNPDDKNKK